jgi:hypothetical protein
MAVETLLWANLNDFFRFKIADLVVFRAQGLAMRSNRAFQVGCIVERRLQQCAGGLQKHYLLNCCAIEMKSGGPTATRIGAESVLVNEETIERAPTKEQFVNITIQHIPDWVRIVKKENEELGSTANEDLGRLASKLEEMNAKLQGLLKVQKEASDGTA